MNYRFLFALFAAAVLFQLAASYEAAGPVSYSGSSSSGLDDLVNAAAGGNQQVANSITATADSAPSPAEAARLSQVQAQLQALNLNPTYQNIKNSEAIADSLAESNLASNIRQGNVNVVSPNVVDQGVFRSLLVPSGRNNHQVIATQPLPPIVINTPGAAPAQISSGPPAVVRAAPVIYKIKPSVIYQQEVINKVPTPLSLNPVYVKVYKPGRKIDAPVAPVVQPVYNKPAPSYGSSDSYAAAPSSYGVPSAYASAPSGYGSVPSGYASAPSGYASAPSGYASAPSGYASAPSSYGAQASYNPSGY